MVTHVLTRGGAFSFHNTCPTRAHVLHALRSWLHMACILLSSCKSRHPRYWNTLTLFNTSPCTVNCWRKASVNHAAMCCWWHLAVPAMQVITCVFLVLVSRPTGLKVVTRPLIAHCKKAGSLAAMFDHLKITKRVYIVSSSSFPSRSISSLKMRSHSLPPHPP